MSEFFFILALVLAGVFAWALLSFLWFVITGGKMGPMP